MKCIACESKDLKVFLRMKDVPSITQVIGEDSVKKDRKISIILYKCLRCTLIQIPKKYEPKQSYYEEYLIDRRCSSFFNKHQLISAKNFVQDFNLKNKNILEVGCGDGFFAELLKNQGAKVTGVDPSEAACALTKKRGIKVIQAYVGKGFKLDKKFDAFSACQVLEHMRDPKGFLSIIRENLIPGGYGFIEVPSLAKTLEEKRFYDFFPDHVAYYNAASLSCLLRASGFDVLDIHQSVKNEFLTAIVKAKKEKKDIILQSEFSLFQANSKSFINSLKAKKVIAWGAGIRGISVISYGSISDKNMKYCIDIDPNKLGMYLPGSHLKVVSPDILKKEDYDVVIITASLYTDEVVKMLRDKYHYRNKIAVIFPSPKYI